ncbi:E3 ubiquitin-protein ligase LNX [Armadillidium nasatum]|uniref:E3 ubiquitin-protein ligase LNX n=1 Tax=Armadillidium nasatum TaxID=96803 RepID=A0A5N5SQP1_9CRUS|nr:E3 ubiquitin-protein ligase LNX [Armadillidium nasatum]
MGPLVTPVDTPCGHTFCKPCLLAFLKVQQNCPIDRKPLTQQLCSFSSLVLKKLLEKLLVKCPNTDLCSVTLPRGDLEDHLKYSRNPVLEGEITFIEIPRTQTALGIAIVGGADTPLRCVVIQEVFPDGLIAHDGRLQAGDQIIEIEGSDMTNASHHQVCTALRRTSPVLRLDELVQVTLNREAGRQLGIKLGGRRSETGIFIMELMAGSVAEQDGRLQPNDRILSINGGDVRCARLDHAFRLIKQSHGHLSLIVSRSNTKDEYNHLFKKPHPELPVSHGRTKSAPERLVEQNMDRNDGRDFNRSFGNNKDLIEGDNYDRSASCESLGDRSVRTSRVNRFHSNGSVMSNGKYSNANSLNSVTDFEGIHRNKSCSLGSVTSGFNKSSRSLISPYSQTLNEDDEERENIPPVLPPRSRQPLGQNHSFDHLNDSELSHLSESSYLNESNANDPNFNDSSSREALDDFDSKESKAGGTALPASGCAEMVDASVVGNKTKVRRSRDCTDIADLAIGMRKSLRLEGSQLHQKTVTISKDASESLGMRIGGGVNSNEGNIPIYIANIHPQGPVGKSKQVKKGDILLSVNGHSLLGLTHTQQQPELAGVTLSVLEGSETHAGPANFVPSWLYWQRLPRALHISKSVVLHRPPGASLGFSIVGGSDPQRGPEPIHVLFVVSTSPAAIDGRLRCGDRLLSVDNHCLEGVSHATAVSLLKQAGQRVTLEVVSWMGTEL